MLDREREKERKEKVFVISVALSMSKKSRRNNVRVILFRLSENFILMDEISEKIFNEELNMPLLVKIQFRENFLNEYKMEIQNL